MSEVTIGTVAQTSGRLVSVRRGERGTITVTDTRTGIALTFSPATGAKLAGLLDRAAMPGQPEAAVAEAGATDPFGGHEFAYESSTDLFRCTRCRKYEVTVREGDVLSPCDGDVPGEPMELNAY